MTLTTNSGHDLYPLGFGTMGLAGIYQPTPSFEQAIGIAQHAINTVNFPILDTARVYGSVENGTSEKIVGEALKQSGKSRDDIFISTKGGLIITKKGGFALGASTAQLTEDFQSSLDNLQTTFIDLYILHRIDHQYLDESLQFLAEAKRLGNIRYIGISEVNADDIHLVQQKLKKLGSTLDVVQNEYSLFHREDETNGVFELCAKYNLTYMAYSPTCRGLLSNNPHKLKELQDTDIRQAALPSFNNADNLDSNIQRVEQCLIPLSHLQSCSASQLALTWTMAQGKHIGIHVLPIPGTTKQERIEENYGAAKIVLAPDKREQLNKRFEPGCIRGERWPDSIQFEPRVKSTSSSHSTTIGPILAQSLTGVLGRPQNPKTQPPINPDSGPDTLHPTA